MYYVYVHSRDTIKRHSFAHDKDRIVSLHTSILHLLYCNNLGIYIYIDIAYIKRWYNLLRYETTETISPWKHSYSWRSGEDNCVPCEPYHDAGLTWCPMKRNLHKGTSWFAWLANPFTFMFSVALRAAMEQPFFNSFETLHKVSLFVLLSSISHPIIQHAMDQTTSERCITACPIEICLIRFGLIERGCYEHVESFCVSPKVDGKIYFSRDSLAVCSRREMLSAVLFEPPFLTLQVPIPFLWNTNTLSYYHHQIGSMNYYPLFRVRSWSNGMRRMSLYILMNSLYD